VEIERLSSDVLKKYFHQSEDFEDEVLSITMSKKEEIDPMETHEPAVQDSACVDEIMNYIP